MQGKKQSPSNGIWDQFLADRYHQSSPKLALWLASFFDPNKHVLDFGCGNAFYIGELASVGFRCTGVEGYKLKKFYHDDILIHDLTKPINLHCSDGNVLSLEVGEHLPEAAEQIFLDTITSHCTGKLVMSWALPGQPGVGHINCKPQEYIMDEVKRRGFLLDVEATVDARKNVDDNTDWFRRTLLVFQRK